MLEQKTLRRFNAPNTLAGCPIKRSPSVLVLGDRYIHDMFYCTRGSLTTSRCAFCAACWSGVSHVTVRISGLRSSFTTPNFLKYDANPISSLGSGASGRRRRLPMIEIRLYDDTDTLDHFPIQDLIFGATGTRGQCFNIPLLHTGELVKQWCDL
jgi:hypothetical protein